MTGLAGLTCNLQSSDFTGTNKSDTCTHTRACRFAISNSTLSHPSTMISLTFVSSSLCGSKRMSLSGVAGKFPCCS